MEIHEAAKVMPEMLAQEFNELKADIERNGQLVPIELLDGQIIDGRHRQRACVDLGIEPEYVDVRIPGSPAEYVWSLNGMRRHLTASQKAAIAVDKAEAKKTNQPKLLTTAQAAEYLGVTASTLHTWRCRRRYAIPFVRVGRAVRYKLADLNAWIEKQSVAK